MTSPGTYVIETLGCKLNFAESSTLGRQLESAGWKAGSRQIGADLMILNTCSVTEFADKKCRQAIRRFKRHNPDSQVIVTGCYAQLKPEDIAAMPDVDLVLGAAEKFNLLKHIEHIQLGVPADAAVYSAVSEIDSFQSSWSGDHRTRAFLKVQDGCDYKCSFCTIPLARGKSRSARIEDVVNQANVIASNGIREIVLTGVNIGDFGIDPQSNKRKESFLDLIQALDRVNIPRIRISSIEPNLCDNDIIEFVADSETFVPHFHMPLQSGSNDMLKRMRRRYRKELYEDRVAFIKQLMPHACIGVDVIVGFHGETDTHFEETFDFLHHMDVSYFHVFTYSERSNTHANSMEGEVPMEVRRQRNQRLRLLSDKKRHYFYSSHVSECRSVLFESKTMQIGEETFLLGHSDNYIQVACPISSVNSNEIHRVQLESLERRGVVLGTVVTEHAFINHHT